ncbi:MAG TPA: dihydroorotate dehydrogenase electron transfer subunit [Gammaproteobacteria bacterium]|nr:dihydroorotate dehydrogenase electron transfer subunit [Gammaproteobacteria bacterium]
MGNRGTLFVEDATILAHDAYEGRQHVLRLEAPRTARRARPGSFVHLQCHDMLPMRRPLSIMRADAGAGWIELLYRVFGAGTRRLAQQAVGQRLSLIGPIGTPFSLARRRARPLLIGGGVGIPPMIFLADVMRRSAPACEPLVLMGSETPFPFTPRPSTILTPHLPDGVIAAMPLMEDWGIASRLASLRDFAGCYHGYVTDLARHWLSSLTPGQLEQVEIFACGPHPMLEAAAAVARDFSLPCQVSLEEFMACAVGGCAGCTVPVQTPEGPAMKRVCVDGPVFDAAAVFPAAP